MDKLKEVFTQIGRDIGSIQEAGYLTEKKARNIFPTNFAVDRQILTATSTLATKAELEELKRPAENANLTEERAYELFPTYATLQSQMTSNIKDKHLELGLDALIDDKLKNGGDPFVTRSKLPTIDTSQLASKNDLEQLKRSVGSGGASGELKGQGFPYALNADIGTIYTDTTAKNGAVKWIKKTAGTGSNAWSVLFGDVKFKPRNINSNQTNAYVEFRRVSICLAA